jgi:hypothetical protein
MKLFTLDAPGFEISWEEQNFTWLFFLRNVDDWWRKNKWKKVTYILSRPENVSDHESVEERGRMYGESI